MTGDFAKLFEMLAGEWSLSREFTSGESFSGKACFVQIGRDALRLSETGTLEFTDQRALNASRSWVWQLDGENALVIHYDEAPLRVYHALQLQPDDQFWRGAGLHLCVDDWYDGNYAFSENRIIINQTVKGPAKRYSLESVYTRIG